MAYKNNLKGITVYRNNSRQFQPMNLDAKKKDNSIEIKPVVEDKVESTEEYNPTGEIKEVKCPECGTKIQMAEGCFICPSCGYSGYLIKQLKIPPFEGGIFIIKKMPVQHLSKFVFKPLLLQVLQIAQM